MHDTPTWGDDWDGLQSNTLLPRRFRSSACLRTPAVRVGLPTSHVGTKAMHAARGAGQAFGQFQYLTSPERIGEDRRRDAVDKVTALSFDQHGNRIWRDAHTLLDSERARYAVGEIAVPYGRCTEPSNVQAGGGACPVRFRCAGCDHFRTDVAFLPDLQAYLDDLLRTRERLAAAIDGLDEWARTDVTPTEEEITRIRRLINRIKGDITQLDKAQRAHIDHAVTVVRHHRTTHTVPLGMPTAGATTPTTSPTTTASEATA
jgi:hypothetical protein